MNTLAALGSMAAFSGAGWATWAMLKPARPREISVRWHDHPTDPLKRVCSGARSVRGSAVYAMFDADGDCEYVGQALTFRQRALAHGKDRKSDTWVSGIVQPCPFWRMSDLERDWTAHYRPTQNRTRGGARRPTLRQVLRARWQEHQSNP